MPQVWSGFAYTQIPTHTAKSGNEYLHKQKDTKKGKEELNWYN